MIEIKEKTKLQLKTAIIMLAIFALFTILIKIIDVKTVIPAAVSDGEIISPLEVTEAEADDVACFKIGFSGLNIALSSAIGYHSGPEKITELLGYLTMAIDAAFCAVGGLQFLKTKSLRGVDKRIMTLIVYSFVVLGCYIVFQKIVVNYRPLLFDEGLEASYPSSHTILVTCLMTVIPVHMRIMFGADFPYLQPAKLVSYAMVISTVILRILSGVHWLTDIIGALLISSFLILLYKTAVTQFCDENSDSFVKGVNIGVKSKGSKPYRGYSSSGKGGKHLAG